MLIVYLIGIRHQTNKAFLMLIIATLVWSGTLTMSQIGPSLPYKLITVTEFLRYFAWLHVLHFAAGYYIDRTTRYQIANLLSPLSIGILFLLSLLILSFNDELVSFFGLQTPTILQFGLLLGFSILGLLLVEQVLRNTAAIDRNSVKLLCISAAASSCMIFLYFQTHC